MKAVVYTQYGAPDVLQLNEVDKPTPKENEVLIRIRATTVTAVDCTFRKGDEFFARLFTGLRKPKNPILGSEFSGDIEAVGNDVTQFEEGDLVFGAGAATHAEYICLPEDGPLVKMPPPLTYEEAAAIPYGALTALPFLRDHAHVQAGHNVLINGASGSVGTFAVQLAKYFGAEVTGVCSTPNVEMVKSLGADAVIDYTNHDFTQNGETYDVIFDAVGKSSYARCKGSLKQGGIYLTTVLTPTILLQMAWTSKIGSKKAAIAFTGLRPPNDIANDLLFLKGLVEEGAITPVIDRRYPLEQIAEAHRYVDKGHKKGNVVITLEHSEKPY